MSGIINATTGMKTTIMQGNDYELAWCASPASISGKYTTYGITHSKGFSLTASSDRITINVTGYYFFETYNRVSDGGSAHMCLNNHAESLYQSHPTRILGSHDHGGGGHAYSHARGFGYFISGDHVSANFTSAQLNSGANTQYNGALFGFRLK